MSSKEWNTQIQAIEKLLSDVREGIIQSEHLRITGNKEMSSNLDSNIKIKFNLLKRNLEGLKKQLAETTEKVFEVFKKIFLEHIKIEMETNRKKKEFRKMKDQLATISLSIEILGNKIGDTGDETQDIEDKIVIKETAESRKMTNRDLINQQNKILQGLKFAPKKAFCCFTIVYLCSKNKTRDWTCLEFLWTT